jgi:hypothetical protein
MGKNRLKVTILFAALRNNPVSHAYLGAPTAKERNYPRAIVHGRIRQITAFTWFAHFCVGHPVIH